MVIEKNSNRARLDYVDVVKGFGILLVCLGHSIGKTDEPFNVFLNAFHMPLFFFVSGLLFYGKDVSNSSFLKFIRRKAFTILLPQLVCTCIGLVWRTLWYVVLTKEMSFSDIITFDIVGWFLIVLFIMEIIMWLALHIKKTLVQTIIPVSFFALFFAITSIHNVMPLVLPDALSDYLWKTAEQICVAVCFGFLGMHLFPLIKAYKEKVKLHGLCLPAFCIVAIISFYNPVLMYINEYGNKLLFILAAVLGVLATFELSFLFEKSKILIYIGKNSIIIYVFQFALTACLLGFSRKLFGWVAGDYPQSYIIFLVLCAVLAPITWFCNKYVPFLFGKTKKH